MIISTVVGDTNEPFYKQLHAAGVRPDRSPVISFSIAEDELRKLPITTMVGDYAAWDYFQAIKRTENQDFVRRFQAKYGAERVTSDVIEAAYNSVYLWAQAVREAESAQVGDVLRTIGRQSLNAPEGIISVDEDSRHTCARCLSAGSGATASSSWCGHRTSQCGQSLIRPHAHVRSGRRSWTVSTSRGGAAGQILEWRNFVLAQTERSHRFRFSGGSPLPSSTIRGLTSHEPATGFRSPVPH